jgi:hypothetical protein
VSQDGKNNEASKETCATVCARKNDAISTDKKKSIMVLKVYCFTIQMGVGDWLL